MTVPRIMRGLCALLFTGTTTCSLIFSASATMAKAASVHVPAAVVWSAVGFLELLSLAGTMRWLTASTTRGRAHAVLVVAAAALVTGQAGWSFYGWWGALAPLAVVGTVHMVAETLRDMPPDTEPAEAWGGPETVPEPGPRDRPAQAAHPDRTARPVLHTVGAAPHTAHDDDLVGLSRTRLREIARDEGVTQRGDVDELTARIRTARAAHPHSPATEVPA